MKKVYAKPEIFFEDFSLSTHIAGECEVKPDDDRLFYSGEGFVFIASACDVPVIGEAGGDGEHNRICYHVPTTGVNVLNS